MTYLLLFSMLFGGWFRPAHSFSSGCKDGLAQCAITQGRVR